MQLHVSTNVSIQIILRTAILQTVNSVLFSLTMGASIYSVKDEEMWEGSKKG